MRDRNDASNHLGGLYYNDRTSVKIFIKTYFLPLLFWAIFWGSLTSRGEETVEEEKPRRHFYLNPVKTQVESAENQYGLGGGATYASATANAAGGSPRSARTVGFFGGYADFALTDWLYFRPEADFIQKGTLNSAGNLARISYLEFPLQIELRLGTNNLNVFFPVGAAVGFPVSADVLSAVGSVQQIDPGAINPIEISAVVGAGVSFSLDSNFGFFAMARFDASLTNAARYSVGGQSASYYSQNISGIIGFTYRYKKRHEMD